MSCLRLLNRYEFRRGRHRKRLLVNSQAKRTQLVSSSDAFDSCHIRIRVCYLIFAEAFCSTIASSMLMHPEVQKRAQLEIDQVLGSGRRPTLDDRDSLPYIQAIYLETLRWHPAVPLSKPLNSLQVAHGADD